GGYILTFPHSRVVTLVLWYVVGVPAWIFLGLWFVSQFFIGDGSGIAWMAHVGGFLAGLGLVRLFTPPGRPVVIDDEYYPPRRRR
ncbi:MAG TPA: rhomboid family intramembrane serine protease, partial [Polyangia bacterium]